MRYERDFTELEQKILEHDLLDVKDWINKAIEGKINQCMKRLIKAEQERLIAKGADTIPVGYEALCRSAFGSKEYLNRVQREALESKIQ